VIRVGQKGRRPLLWIAIAGLAVGLTACQPLSADELRREVDTVHSTAAEAAVLADQVARQSTKRTFARVQARELSDSAQHSAERLTDAHPADGLEGATERAIALAEEVSSAAGQVETAPDDAVAAARTANRLRELAQQTEELAGSI
jgi:hypothetical protein